MSDSAALESMLRGLAVSAPSGLIDRVFDKWVKVPVSASGVPDGTAYVAFSSLGVTYLRIADGPHGEAEFTGTYGREFGRPLSPARQPPPGLMPALAGRPSALRLDLRHASEFQRDVLAAVRRIPRGETRPHAWIARETGRPSTVEEVQKALIRNPVPILVPCHRVIPADGSLGEYVLGGALKEYLLNAERVNLTEVRDWAARGAFYIGSDTTNIFCFPTCRNARRITERHRREFRDPVEAAREGYRPCKHCRPNAA